MLLAHAIALSTGGIPLIYLGDEVAQLNDLAYLDDPALAGDSRWVNRPRYPAAAYAQRHDPATPAGAVYAGLTRMIEVRRSTAEFAVGPLVAFDARHPHVLGYQRHGVQDAAASAGPTTTVLVLANLGDEPAQVDALTLSGYGADAHELISDRPVSLARGLVLDGCHVVWLRVTPNPPLPRF